VRWLVTGARGRLGRDLVRTLQGRDGTAVTAADRRILNITEPAAIRTLVAQHDVVVNAAAWTDVDGAERSEAAATAVNGEAVRQLARACARSSAWLIHISTDYVFSGRARTPYPENAEPDPINAYGRSKLAGERAVAAELPARGQVIRTAWLYGGQVKSFVDEVLRRGNRGEPVRVVTDQRGQPTWISALTGQIIALGDQAWRGAAGPGVYHGTATGHASRYELARAAFELAGLDPDRVRPVTTAEFPLPARRPAYTVLEHSRWASCSVPAQPHWRDQLAAFLSTDR
jgi:dTDP-4-dehydrorhamnose reductase